MNIKPVDKYSTDIKWITDMNSKNTIFISGWDKAPNILNIDNRLILDTLNKRNHQNSYIMSKDIIGVKNKIVEDFKQNNYNLKKDCITIVSNGTSAAFVSLLQMFKINIENILFIGPIYFTYYHLANMLKQNLYYFDINPFDNIFIDFNILKNEIINRNIKCAIITLPLFGTGVSLEMSVLSALLSVCEETKTYLIVDYVYGNMEWAETRKLHNYSIVDLCLKSQYCILYESIPKRIFLNGIKSAIIYSNSKLINEINTDSEICQGSISFIQESLLDIVYEYQNNNIIINTVEQAVEYSKNNYNLIKTMLLNTDFLISKTNSGYFSLIAIPLKYFNNKTDNEIVREIYLKCGVLTIPHSRYNYNLAGYYCFRVNLVLDTKEIIDCIKKLLYICDN